MIFLDTSIWIEFLRARDPIYSHVVQLFQYNRCCSASWVFGELLQGVQNKKETHQLLAFWEQIPKLKLEFVNDVWIEAGALSSQQQGLKKGVGLIDYAILKSTEKMNAKLWTLDKRLLSVTPSNLIYKYY